MLSSFPPIADPNSRLLILGTMPGEQSLRLGQYYGNPRNHFWRLIYTLFDDGVGGVGGCSGGADDSRGGGQDGQGSDNGIVASAGACNGHRALRCNVRGDARGEAGRMPHAEYAERIDFVRRHGVALWDVLASCEREGSLDSRIRQEQANDFAAFFAAHPQIRHVFFNGAAAEKLYLKHAASSVSGLPLTFHRLPSSSPALTAPFEQKLAAWKAIREV